MSVDFIHDLITIYGISVKITTLALWSIGAIFVLNNMYQAWKLLKMESTKQRNKKLEEIAVKTYYKVEKITKLTPTVIDDKLLSYVKLCIDALMEEEEKEPTPKEVKWLMSYAEYLAAKQKILLNETHNKETKNG